ncbi:MAG TPA: AMP-binding protein, partial [Actinophytocola sp.]|uniref:AMP-binding protein n=1 Tax=Actinophytocola sp. TaxID=1872138 RepID=UPI002F949DA8
MLGTMQDGQLSIANLLRHGSRVHANAEVVTWTGEGARRATYADIAREAARLAHALRGLGVTSDQRVGTFMWNNNEHLVAYLAVPAMGAVLHTLNIRLFPEQLTYVANHAEDHVVLVDGTLVPLLAKVLPTFETVKHVVVVNGDAGALTAPEGVTVHSYADLLADQPDEFDWPAVDENSA